MCKEKKRYVKTATSEASRMGGCVVGVRNGGRVGSKTGGVRGAKRRCCMSSDDFQ